MSSDHDPQQEPEQDQETPLNEEDSAEEESLHIGDPDSKGRRITPWSWIPTVNFAQGIQFTLVTQLFIVIFKTLGLPNGQILLWTSSLALPWTIKPLWGPLVDRYWTKRNWTVWMQLTVGLCFVGTAFAMTLGNDRVPFINMALWFAVSVAILYVVAFAGATHDIACDGFYMLALSEKKQAFYVGIRSTAFRLGWFSATGVLVFFASVIQNATGLDPVSLEARVTPPGEQQIQVDKLSNEAADYAPDEQGIIIEPATLSLDAGDQTQVRVRLNKAPEENEEFVVIFRHKQGDKSVTISPERLEFDGSNWCEGHEITVKTDIQTPKPIATEYVASAGNIKLSWFVVIFGIGVMFILFFLYHRIIMPYPSTDMGVTGDRPPFYVPLVLLALTLAVPAFIFLGINWGLGQFREPLQIMFSGKPVNAAEISTIPSAVDEVGKIDFKADKYGKGSDPVVYALDSLVYRIDAAANRGPAASAVYALKASVAEQAAEAIIAAEEPGLPPLEECEDGAAETEGAERSDEMQAVQSAFDTTIQELESIESEELITALEEARSAAEKATDPAAVLAALENLGELARSVDDAAGTGNTEENTANPIFDHLATMKTDVLAVREQAAANGGDIKGLFDNIREQARELASMQKLQTKGFNFFFAASRLLILILLGYLFFKIDFLREPAGRAFQYASDVSRIGFADVFITFFKKERMMIVLGFLLTFRLGEQQLAVVKNVFLIDTRENMGLAMTLGEFSFTFSVVYLGALTVGGLLGGYMIARFGMKLMTWWMVAAMHIPNFLYIGLAYAMPQGTMPINLVVGIEAFGYGFGFTFFLMVMIIAADGPYKTAHYALCTGFMALGAMLPGMWSGFLQELVGYQVFFILVMLFCLPGIAFIPFLPIDPNFGKKKK